MFYSLLLNVKAENNGIIEYYPGRKIHGWFFSVLKSADERISNVMHSNISDKSFTVSSFLGRNVSRPLEVKQGEVYSIRITLLEDSLFELFSNKVFESTLKDENARFGNVTFKVLNLSVGQSNKWAGFTTEEELFNKDNTQTVVKLKFYTPTLFRIGDLHLREPDPEKVYTSLIRKFNKYSKVKLDENLVGKFKDIKILEKDTILKRVNFGEFYLQGFVGTVTFEVPYEDKLVEAVNVLSNFAFYSGVGYKSTMGLGQCKREEL
ncbi:MAG: CRISPR-associated endoribonuclease Cas6 [Fervidobacterium sp.]|uniref:CRISPR-associated endoribonuclease Cas6 n=1 Tax=Fervidobacterium sp. TaxID=1871331 RepID=UPI00309C10F3